MRRHWVLRVIGFALLGVLFVGVMGAVVMLLWNLLLPSITTGVRAISFWEAIGLLILARILFGGFRGRWHGHWHGGWRHRMHERWAQMTPEEREKFREGMRARCGWRHAHDHDSKPTVPN